MHQIVHILCQRVTERGEFLNQSNLINCLHLLVPLSQQDTLNFAALVDDVHKEVVWLEKDLVVGAGNYWANLEFYFLF